MIDVLQLPDGKQIPAEVWVSTTLMSLDAPYEDPDFASVIKEGLEQQALRTYAAERPNHKVIRVEHSEVKYKEGWLDTESFIQGKPQARIASMVSHIFGVRE